MASTAAIVIVGDEILAGHTQDTNSHWLAQRLRSRGVRLLRVEAVPDDVPEIDAALRRLVALGYDWVLVVGGLGPTPDDRTYEAIGRALGVALEIPPEHLAAMRSRVAKTTYAREAWADPDTSEPMRRMIRIPKGSHALANPVGAALGCVANAATTRVAVFPGVPGELMAMFDDVFAPRFLPQGAAEAVEELEVRGAEASYWDILTTVAGEYPEVRVGSYPQDHAGRLILRLSGPEAAAKAAKKRLTRLLERR